MYKEFYAQAYLTIMLFFISPGMQELHQLMTRLYLNEIFLNIIWWNLQMKWKMWTGNL